MCEVGGKATRIASLKVVVVGGPTLRAPCLGTLADQARALTQQFVHAGQRPHCWMPIPLVTTETGRFAMCSLCGIIVGRLIAGVRGASAHRRVIKAAAQRRTRIPFVRATSRAPPPNARKTPASRAHRRLRGVGRNGGAHRARAAEPAEKTSCSPRAVRQQQGSQAL